MWSSNSTPDYIFIENKNTNSWRYITPVSIGALFTIAKIWKHSKCPSTAEWIKKMHHTHTHTHTHTGILLNHKKSNILPFVIPWVNLGNTVLCEISQTEKGKYYVLSHTYMCLKDKNKQMNVVKQKRPTDIRTTSHYQCEEERGCRWDRRLEDINDCV